MSNRIKIISIAGLFIVVVAVGYTFYLYNKPHRSVSLEEAAYSLTAEDLYRLYSINEAEANKLYLDKVLLVKGKIREIINGEKGYFNIILETKDEVSGVSCSIIEEDGKIKDLKEGELVQIKGLCTGMLIDVVLIDGSLEKL